MSGACECGMLHEAWTGPTTCHECGTRGCRSCAVEIETNTYCRWCATSLAPAAA
jgi:hypothetical protein